MISVSAGGTQPNDFIDFAKSISQLGAPAILVIGIAAFLKGWAVPWWVVKDLRERIVEMQNAANKAADEHQRQLEAKDAALQRKDDTYQALQTSVMHDVMPALTRAVDLVKAYETKVVVRHD